MEPGNFTLSELQNWMQGILMQPAQPLLAMDSDMAEVEDRVKATKRLSAVNHLNIYRHSYISRLRDCMKNQFSALAYALGEDLFQAFADQYLEVYPSASYTLNSLGRRFPAFLEETRPNAGEEDKESWPDFMIELAGFEYQLSQVFDEYSDSNPPGAPSETPDEALKLVPVFHLFKHQYPICAYYLDFVGKKEPELPFPSQSYCVVTRINYRLGLFPINDSQFAFLSILKDGHTLDEGKTVMVEKLGYKYDDIVAVWPRWRAYFIQSGFFVADGGGI
jgi:hypothetical protein